MASPAARLRVAPFEDQRIIKAVIAAGRGDDDRRARIVAGLRGDFLGLRHGRVRPPGRKFLIGLTLVPKCNGVSAR
ncbi:hypothetical protein [Erythrobacter sp. WG]|uniref:hypothetical protein n=1 Tax=Erythrobacter sp. WG TaxID=2985510 RepID=UPI002271775D|nr:hypothetical protein [Erythrobacter sp. WG]MCX9148332.1 hypothetical protein [Erythrobacter sp. WG]